MSTVITETEAKQNIAANIHHILDALGWSVRKLVFKSGVPQNTVYCIARGDFVPNAVHLRNIADALGVTTDRLMESPKTFQKVG